VPAAEGDAKSVVIDVRVLDDHRSTESRSSSRARPRRHAEARIAALEAALATERSALADAREQVTYLVDERARLIEEREILRASHERLNFRSKTKPSDLSMMDQFHGVHESGVARKMAAKWAAVYLPAGRALPLLARCAARASPSIRTGTASESRPE